ncbi:hypothetical protein O5O45_05750 [Hahella aquimaris]|uniref:glycine cleavage system protein H n=1 Tax=Hahella sp. HNIBRBA332 TaxID=3015983 RepID=UPI00273A7D33|nr:hypothetical protein [Hahella sp. HNIBRBA332]WLQ15422.1 hypothetical protein O5O45_05750 [Hahella sp. HNIBRBA332]
MNKVTDTLRYYSCHEWVCILAGYAVVGVTDFVSELKGTLRLTCGVDYHKLYSSGERIGTLETIKGEKLPLIIPLSGYIVSINNHPSAIINGPYGNGWLLIIKIKDYSEFGKLLSEKDYETTFRGPPSCL